MKPISTIWLCFAILIGLCKGLDAQISIDPMGETERKKLSVMLLVDGCVRTIGKEPMDTQGLYEEIDNNKSQHQEKENSITLSRAYIKQKLQEDLQVRISHILNTSGLKKNYPAWCRDIEISTLKQSKVLFSENLSQSIDDTFSNVRTKVVKQQQSKLINFAVPKTRQDYLNVEKKSTNLQKDLIGRSIKMYNEPIFSENRDFLAKKVSDIIQEAWRQFDEQRRIISNSHGGGRSDITIDSIQSAIQQDIESYRVSIKNPYSIFPSVQESIRPKSRELASRKFNRWVDSWNYFIPVDRISFIIAEDSDAHHIKPESRQILSRIFLSEIQEKIVGDYIGKLSSNDQQGLRIFLEEQPSFYVEMEGVVEKSIKNFEDARKDVSRAQFTDYFPTLADSSWKLNENAIQKRYNHDKIKDNQAITKDFLVGKQIVEETGVLVEQAVSRLADKGDAAIKHQMSLVKKYREVMDGTTSPLFEEVSDSEMKADSLLSKLVVVATKDIQQTWSGIALSSEYPQLFVDVKNQIRKEIKDLFAIELKRREQIHKAEGTKRIEQQRVAQSKQIPVRKIQKGQREKKRRGNERGTQEKGESKGRKKDSGTGSDGRVGAGSGSAVKKVKNSPDVIFDIDIENERIVIVVINMDNTDPFTFTFPLGKDKYEKYQAMVRPHLEKVENRLKGYFAGSNQDPESGRIYIVTRVFHVRVPYGLVYDLREIVRKAVKTLDGKRPVIFWYDDFFTKRDPVQLQDIRKRSSRLETGW